MIILGIVLANNCFAYQTVVDPVIYENNNSYLNGWIIGVPDLELIRPAFVCSAAKATYPRVVYGYENKEKQIVRAFEVVSNKDLRAANCQLTLQTELETVEPETITSRWATLRGRLATNGGKFKITFKIWAKSEKEPQYDAATYLANYKAKDFFTTDKPTAFSFNARYFSFYKPFIPKGEYCYRAVAIDSNQKIIEANNYECFAAQELNSRALDQLDVPFYSQSDNKWGNSPVNTGTSFDADGCLNTAMAMIVRYWYDRDPVVRKNWQKMYSECIAKKCRYYEDWSFISTGQTPNPFSFHWVGTFYSGGKEDSWNFYEPWRKLGLVVRPITQNDPASLKAWYLERGVPVIFMCTPSYVSTHIRHYGVLLGFYNNKIFNTPEGQFLDYMYINDPAQHTMTAGKGRRLTVAYNNYGAGVPRCGYQPEGTPMLDPNGTAPYSKGLAAIYPVGFKMDGFTPYPNQ